MPEQTINIPRESTVKAMLDVQRGLLLSHGTKEAVLVSGDPAVIDTYFNGLANKVTSVAEMDALFVEWWNHCYIDGETNKGELLERWFGTVLEDNRVHGVKMPLFSTSTSAIAELTDDSKGLTCEASTEASPGQDDFAYLPQFWCLEVSAEKNEDGTHEIFAVEHIDDIEDVRSGEHLCWVLQKNTYTREWQDNEYHYFKMRCHKTAGYDTWPQGTDRNGRVYAYIANPKYYAGLTADGNITCGAGLEPALWNSHQSGVNKWRTRGSQYSGASGNLLKWQLAMIWLKYGVKGNSGTIEGCSSYNFQYTAAVSEEGVERVLITETQAANIFEGSAVELGTGAANADRNTAGNYSIFRCKRVKSKEKVRVQETDYIALNIDNGGEKFDVVAGQTRVSTMPYYSGWNDNVQGFDGSKFSPTTGKEPGLIQKTEFQIGAYIIISDELWQWGTNEAGDYTFDCFTCHDQSKVSSAINGNYEKKEGLTLVFPKDTSTSGEWWYTEDIAVCEDKAVLWPKAVSKTAGSGTGNKAGFYVHPASSGVRAAWCVCHLHGGGNAGLPARNSNYSVSLSTWPGAPGAPGLAG